MPFALPRHPIGDLCEALYVQGESIDRYREVLRAVVSADHVHEGFCCQAHVDACDLLGVDVRARCC